MSIFSLVVCEYVFFWGGGVSDLDLPLVMNYNIEIQMNPSPLICLLYRYFNTATEWKVEHSPFLYRLLI